MSFRIGSGSKSSPSQLPKGKGGISLGGFSFKQLEEEEEEEEDLSVFTGKYDKVLEESQKVQKRTRESTHSTSSNSSTSSITSELKGNETKASDKQAMSKDINKTSKAVPLDAEETSSPLRRQAKAKLESSKELFSGLKGKISDKISKTIEEFSSDSSTNPSPDYEKVKPVPIQVEKNNSTAPIVAESVNLLHSAAPVTEHPLISNDDDVDESQDEEEDTEHTKIFKTQQEEDTLSVTSAESFEDGTDSLVFHDIYTNEPYEDFTGTQGLSTSTRVKSKSKLKRLIHKKSKRTSASATLSGLASLPEQIIVSPSSDSTNIEKNDETEELSSKPEKPNPSSPKASVLMTQLNKADYSELPFHKFAIISVVIFAYMIFPLPSYLSGFVMGCLLTSLGGLFYLWLTKPLKHLGPIILPPIDDSQPPPVPEMKLTDSTDETSYKGWMNEVAEYKVDDYHINQTHSVFISLEGTHLRLQRPKNPPPRRAMWDETITKPQFIHQRHYDLPGARVYLFPFGLVKKRIWSKKYPICIAFPKVGVSSELKETEMRHASSEPLLDGIDHSKMKERDLGFEIISEESVENVLYLFARTGREKEDWFKRFSAASCGRPLANHVCELKRALEQVPTSNSSDLLDKSQKENTADRASPFPVQPKPQEKKETTHLEGADLRTFAQYMGRLMPSGPSTPPSRGSSPTHVAGGGVGGVGRQEKEEAPAPRYLVKKGPISCDNQLFWVNALIGRCFFDFLRDEWWIGKVTEKLQRKLSKIRVPYFIEELQVTSIDMGYEIPAISHAGKPFLDERGFWVDMDITYSGGFNMTIETKINLMKLKKSPHASNSEGHSVDSCKSAITDSDEEDSVESSTDDEEEVPSTTSDRILGQVPNSKTFLRYLDKFTKSRYFQQATEYKVIRRAMENVSNTPLTLNVTVNSLIGKLAINIPPPPSDRLWYGFRTNPNLRLSAKPQVGERAVKITHVTEWIEKKLALEFQRVFVMPNMDDLVIPILVPGDSSQRTMSRSSSL